MNSPVFRFPPAVIALLVGLLLAPLAQAAPLTDRQIQAVIDIQKDLDFIEQEFPELDRRAEQINDMANPVSSFLPLLDDYPDAESRLESVVEKHGFDDLQQWASVADRVYTSVMAIGFRDMSPQERKMFDEMANTPVDDDVPEYMKAQMAEIREHMQGAERASKRASDADIEAVRPFLDQLNADNDE